MCELTNDSFYRNNNLSTIDFHVDAFLSKRHKFPRKDPISVKKFKDNRTAYEKFNDIVNTCNQKISPELLPEWEKLVGRSIVEPCYYKSGLNFGKNLLQKAQKEFKLKNGEIEIDPTITMPECLKDKPNKHSQFCNPEGNKCIYLCEKEDTQKQMEVLFKEEADLLNKLDCKNLCTYLIKNAINRIKHGKPGPINILSKFKKIISKGASLKKSFKIQLLKIYKTVFNFDQIKLQDSTPRQIYLSNLMKTKLPFAKGVMLPKHHTNKNKMLNLPIKKFLIDSGSDTNIISLKEVKQMGFSERDLQPCGSFTLNGSTGQVTDCFLGIIKITLYLQSKRDGKFYSHKVLFYVSCPDLNLSQIILGQPYLDETQTKIYYENKCISVRSTLYDEHIKESKKVQLQLFSSLSGAELINEEEISKGQRSAVFSLKIKKDYDFYSQCIAETDDICFPLLDFGSIMTACYFNNKIIQEHQTNLRFMIPFAQESKTVIETNRIIKLKNCNFVNAEIIDSIFCPENVMNVNESQASAPHSSPMTSDTDYIQKESQRGARSDQEEAGVQAKCQGENKAGISANKSVNVSCQGITQNENIFEEEFLRNSLEMEVESKNYFSNLADPTYSDFNMNKNFEYISPLPENPIQSQESFISETLEQKECFSKVVDENTIGRISLNSKQGEEHLYLKKQQLQHLNKNDQKKITDLVKKYEEFWAKKSSSIGTFNGFKARLEVEDDSPCWQKERRMNLSHVEGIEKCIEGLMEEGVFKLSDSDHDKYACNINVVAKEENTIRSSKADKHIARQQNVTQSPAGFRATFDFTTLNTKLTNVGKLSLPSISEIQQKTRNCVCSVIDLKNMFFSIVLEEESKAKTNFYWKNRIMCHNRLGQGLSVSPYISAAAMNYTFSDKVLERFKNEFSHQDLPFTSFNQFLDFYIDDVILYNKRNISCNKYDPTTVHYILLECVIWALNEAGWKGSLKKCSFMPPSFQFLGIEINTESNSSKMLSNRVESIQEWRSPLSAGEASSRLSVLGYFSKHIPFLRLLALPIYNAIAADVFEWTEECEIAFSNLKFIISLQIELYHYDPEQILVITSDASAVGMNASFFNFNKITGELSLVDTQTKLFAGAELRYTPVQKENMSLMFALFKGESYIRANKAETWSLCDASSLQYIQRSKAYNSKQFNQSIFISSLPRLNIYYVSGKSLLISDVMSRQFQDIYLKNNNELSEPISKLIPPLQNLNIENLTRLSNEHLTDFLLRNPRKEVIDTYPKRFHYVQDVHRTQLHNGEQNLSSEWQLFAGLNLGWNSTAVLSLPVWQDIQKSKGDITKSLATQVTKTHNLHKIHQKILDSNIKDNVMQSLLEKFHLIKDRETPISSSQNLQKQSFSSGREQPICSCKECECLLRNMSFSKDSFDGLLSQASVLSNFIKSSIEIIGQAIPSEIENYKQRNEKLNCLSAKLILDIYLFHFICATLYQNQINLNNIQVCFLNFYLSNNFELKIAKDGKLQIFTRKALKFEALNNIQLDIDFLLAFQGNICDIKCNFDELLMLESPISSGPIFNIPFISLCNLEDKDFEIKENTCIITLDLSLSTENVILMKSEKDILEKRINHFEDHNLTTSLNNLTNLMLGMTSFYSKITANCYQSTNFLSKIERQQHISSLVHQAEIDKNELPHAKNSKNLICNYSSQREKIGQILLSQNLLKNNGIFSSKVMKEIQREDKTLKVICRDLESGEQTYKNRGFSLEKGILYKESWIFGKRILKLAIPDHLAMNIIENFHKVKGMHYPVKQISKIFQTNFYSPNHSKIISKVGKQCSICQLCQRNYKKKSVGIKRTFEDNVNPGEIMVADVAYMNRDKFGFKYIMVFVCRLTSYACCIPMKELNANSSADALRTYLNMFPAMRVLQVDGDGSFSAAFEETCHQNQIFLKTKLPRSSQTNSTAEVSIRDLKNLMTKLANQHNGRNAWSRYLSLCMQAFNKRHVYNCEVSRANLYLSPFFYNNLNYIFCPPEFLPQGYNKDLIKFQRLTFDELNNKRKASLYKLHQKLTSPASFILKAGQILTDNTSKDERETIDGSKALIPGSLKLFKVLKVHDGGQGALVKNLHTGQIKTVNVENLRSLSVPDILDISIDPKHAFSELLPDSRSLNLHGKYTSDIIQDDNQDDDPARATRSGHVYLSLRENYSYKQPVIKSCLKKCDKIPVNLDLLDCQQFDAYKRGLNNAKQAGKKLDCQQLSALVYKQKRNLQLYNVGNTIVLKKTKPKIKFNDVIYWNYGKLNEEQLMDQKQTNQNKCINFAYCFLQGDVSFEESKCLKNK